LSRSVLLSPLLLLLLLFGCANQVSPMADAGTPDGGAMIDDGGSVVEDGGETSERILERANLAPAVGVAESERLRIIGRLRADGDAEGDGLAETANHSMRGGLVPTTR
jgi:hypothetical protein